MRQAGTFSTSEVAELLKLKAEQIRRWVKNGVLAVERGKRDELRFSFADLVLLRTAKALQQANVSHQRIRRALNRLRSELPEGRPLTALSIGAEGKEVVARDGAARWQPDSGQLVFNFEVAELAQAIRPLTLKAAREARKDQATLSAQEWYDLAYELELTSIDEARDAYRRAIELEPDHVDAHVNLGRLLHEAKETEAALSHYQVALKSDPEHLIAWFNQGVALQDMGQDALAVAAYERVIALDSAHADAHYNLGRLYEKLGRPILALRHLRAYEHARGR